MDEISKIIEKCAGSEMPFCQAACPLHVDMKSANALIREGKFDEALKIIKQTLPFPGILGRVCTHPCESKCKRKDIDEPVLILNLKRSAADYGSDVESEMSVEDEKGFNIAVIGGGPAGMMAAYNLRKAGYKVTIFEAMPVLGGMMALCIPRFRLPADILKNETNIIERLGIELKLNTRVGRDISLSEIKDKYNAVFIAVGAHKARDSVLVNSNAEGAIQGIEFLNLVNADKPIPRGDSAVIIGGGNVAVDCARTCVRLGFRDVKILYRRSRAEMPAIPEEIAQAEQEGIKIQFLVNPSRLLTENRRVVGLECVRTELGQPDESGRQRPDPVAGSDFVIKTDLLITAIGEAPDVRFLENTIPSIVFNSLIKADMLTLATGEKGFFAGGDAVTGPSSVIQALAAGRKAAISIDRYLQGKPLEPGRENEGRIESGLKVSIEGIPEKNRVSVSLISPEIRKHNFDEVVSGFSREEAREEADRCLNCECKVCVKNCLFLETYCRTPRELAEKFKTGYFKEETIVPYSCNLCGLCQNLCPQDLNIGAMCQEIRDRMVEEGIGPLTEHELVREDQEWSKSDAFSLMQTDTCDKKSGWVFFPGCSLSAYSPKLVVDLYDYLKQHLPGTGIILNCCGAPTHCLGEHTRFEEMLNSLESRVKKLGASGVLVACPDCYLTIKRNAPALKVKSVYEAMLEYGLPEKALQSGDYTFSLHDSCTARGESAFTHCVRELVKQMGYRIEEMEYSGDKTRCCGAGGMVPYVDLELYMNLAQRRTEEASCDMLTYCATCRETFASVGKESIHVLDLIFNPDWKNSLDNPPKMGKAKHENQAEIKRLLTGSRVT